MTLHRPLPARCLRISLCVCVDAESKGMVFRQTKLIPGPFIHECERTGRKGVPGICRNHIESSLQFCLELWALLSGAMQSVESRKTRHKWEDLLLRKPLAR